MSGHRDDFAREPFEGEEDEDVTVALAVSAMGPVPSALVRSGLMASVRASEHLPEGMFRLASREGPGA